MCKTPRRSVFYPGEAESIMDAAATLIVRHPVGVPGLLSAMQLAARLSDLGVTTEHVTLAVDEWLANRGAKMTNGLRAPIGNVISKGDTVWRDQATGYVYTEPAPGRLKAIVIENPSSGSNEVAVRLDRKGESNEPT